tara:strand:- start:1199 stop:2347 length:1149 start_codon:yes stop_codon:yes gene_type:complete
MDSIKLIKNILTTQKCTLLGIGPMSKNCVDTTIEIANKHDVPLMIIASRRQIECMEFGGGYVNNWSTEEFAKYIQMNDVKRNIILCRDHGGPFQGKDERKLDFEKAMENAKKSFLVDIKSNFKILHIDPSEFLEGKCSIEQMLPIIHELYDFCYSTAKDNGKEIFIEISIGREDGGVHKYEDVEYAISNMESFCNTKKFPLPLFIVVRTGNYVMETRNIGIFEEIVKGNKKNDEENIRKIIKLCNQKNIMIKEHNADYISEDALRFHTELGIHAINVAPEFGVIQTKAMLEWFEKNNLYSEKQQFLDISFQSDKWKKWIIPHSEITDMEKAIISGHYVYSDPRIIDMLEESDKLIEGDKLDACLKRELEKNHLRYMKCLKLI